MTKNITIETQSQTMKELMLVQSSNIKPQVHHSQILYPTPGSFPQTPSLSAMLIPLHATKCREEANSLVIWPYPRITSHVKDPLHIVMLKASFKNNKKHCFLLQQSWVDLYCNKCKLMTSPAKKSFQEKKHQQKTTAIKAAIKNKEQ